MRARKLVAVLILLGFGFGGSLIGFADQISIQPGPEGQDVWITSTYDYGSDYGVDDDRLQVGGWGDRYYTLINFDLTGLPVMATKVTMWLYCRDRGDSSTTVGMSLYLPTSAWNEDTGWYSQPSAILENGNLPAPAEEQWYQVDVTAIYNQWQNGSLANYGLELRPLGTNNQFNLFASSDYSDPNLRPMLVIDYDSTPPPFKLSFPLLSQSPYTARCVAVFDNDPRRGIVRAYDGEEGAFRPYVYGSRRDNVIGYQKKDGTDFVLSLIENYDDQVSNSGRIYLFYDGHNGYDYPMPAGTPIVAAGDGKLAIATGVKRPPKKGGLWRNNKICPMPKGVGDNEWDDHHTIFILHGDPDDTSSWYLHDSDLDPLVKLQVALQGYAQVMRNQVIAYVGKWGASSNHLHFGVRQGRRLVDPYGTGDSTTTDADILWDVLPDSGPVIGPE